MCRDGDSVAFTRQEFYSLQSGTSLMITDVMTGYRDNIFTGNNSMELSENQAALILGTSEEGSISVDVAGADLDGLPGALCQAIAVKLMEDENFQAELMQLVDNIGE